MSIKIFKNGAWNILPGTMGPQGKNIYEVAVEAGFKGTQDEFQNYVIGLVESQDQIDSNTLNIQTIGDDVNSISNDVEGLRTSKQDTLVSGLNIRTINGISLLGEGDVPIQIDAAGFNYIFFLTEDPIIPDDMDPSLMDSVQVDNHCPQGWFTSPREVSELYEYQWVSTRSKSEGVWSKWSTPVIYNTYVTDGITPEVTLTGFVFCRSNNNLIASDIAPTGGNFTSPTPTNSGTIGGVSVTWTDSIPAGNEKVWMTSCVFNNVDDYTANVAQWSVPRQMSDTASFQVEYSKDEIYTTPESLQDYYVADSVNYEDNWRENNKSWLDDGTDAIWMATSTMSNGVWGDWKISKIKGERGTDGTSLKVLGTLDDESELPKNYTGDIGDGYVVKGNYWVWDGDSWEDAGPLQGPAGAASYVHIKYATMWYDPSNSDQFETDGTWKGWTATSGETPGDYIGLYTDNTEEDILNPALYTWKKWQGEDGFGYEYIFKTTTSNIAPELPADTTNSNGDSSINDGFVPNGWNDDPVDVSESTPYCWQCYRKKTDGVWSSFKGSASTGKAALWAKYGEKGADGTPGSDGIDGETGAGIEYIYIVGTVDTTNWSEANLSNPNNTWNYQGAVSPWTNDPQGVDPTNKVEWVSFRIKPQGKDTWENWSTPIVWSRFSEDGKDGPGLEYVFVLSTSETLTDEINNITTLAANQNDDYVPSYTYNNTTITWSDDNLSVSKTIKYLWSSIRKKKNGVWQQFETPVLWNRYASDGISPNTAYKSTVFVRSNSTPSTPTGGSYKNPVPTGWSDGIPDGAEILWASTRIFSSDGLDPQQDAWSTPRQMTDTANFDVEFSSVVSPSAPSGHPNTNTDWTSEAGENTIWMATSVMNNGVWSDWQISRIKGENGQDGTSIKIKGTVNSESELPNPPADSSDCYIIGQNLWVWDGDSWVDAGQFKGEKGENGENGADGLNAYVHIKYAKSLTEDDWSDNDGETPDKYIGIYVDNSPTDELTWSKYSWSKWRGEDGFGYEYIYKRTGDNIAPVTPTDSNNSNGDLSTNDNFVPNNWTDDPSGVNTEYPYEWVCYRKKVDGVWGSFIGSYSDNTKAALWAKFGNDGTSPAAMFKSTAFIRSNSEPDTPEGGSYKSPTPTTTGWSDGIPEGTQILWASTRTFTSDGVDQDTLWSTPQQISDTTDFQVEFSSETTYVAPTSLQSYYDADPVNYEENWRTANKTWSDTGGVTTIWMATSTLKNGKWSDWSVSKIKGEDGQNGTNIKVKGSYASLEAFEAVWGTEGNWKAPADSSDCYIVVTNLYVWDGDSWNDVGPFKGDKGDSTFLHIKYANAYIEGTMFTATINGKEVNLQLSGSNGEEPGKYIGTFADETSTDPDLTDSRFSKYVWSTWQGEDGFGYEYIYIRTKNDSAPELPDSVDTDDYVPTGWTDGQIGVTSEYPFEWVAHRKKKNGTWGEFIGSKDNPGYAALCSRYAQDGGSVNFSGSNVYFGYSDDSKTKPTSWIDEADYTTWKGKYLWTKTTVTFVDSNNITTSTDNIVCVGLLALNIVDTTEYWGITKSNTTPPDIDQCTTTRPTELADDEYLWSIIVITYDDGTEKQLTPTCVTAKDGIGIRSVTEYYLLSTKSTGVTKDEFGDNTTISNPTAEKPYLWNYEKVIYDNGTFNDTEPVVLAIYTKDGKGIKSITEYYLITNTTTAPSKDNDDWSTDMQTPTADKPYLWNKEVITYTDDTADTFINLIGSRGVDGANGKDGQDGKDGTSITVKGTVSSKAELDAIAGTAGDSYVLDGDLYVWDGDSWENVGQFKGDQGDTGVGVQATSVMYAVTTKYVDPTTIDNWQSDIPTATPEQYLWTRIITDYTDGKDTVSYSYSYQGKNGTDGRGIETVEEYYLVAERNVVIDENNYKDYTWSTDVPEFSDTAVHLWNYETITLTDGKSYDTIPAIIGSGKTGKGIKSITDEYGVSNSDEKEPDNWVPSSKEVFPQPGQYLWTRETVTYTTMDDNGEYESDVFISIVGYNGTNGTSVTITSIEYQAGSSNTTAPTGTWLPNPVAVEEGQYLWSKTTFSDGNVVYGIAKQGSSGKDGENGRGISSIVDWYAVSSSATEAPLLDSGDWQSMTPPSFTQEKVYLWNYEVITYDTFDDKGEAHTYQTDPMVIGSAGKDGRGIESVVDRYILTDDENPPVSSAGDWKDEPMIPGPGQYLWNEETVTYTDGQTETTLTCIGYNGKDAEQFYLHIKYATKISAVEDAYEIVTDPSTAKYIGTYNGTEEDSPTDYDLYNWSRFLGEDGFGYEYEYNYNKTGVVGTYEGNWADNPYDVSDAQPYVFMRYKKTNEEGWSTPVLWSKWGKDGAAGKDGDGVEYIYCLNGGSTPENPTPSDWETNSTYQQPEYTAGDWLDNPAAVSAETGESTLWLYTRRSVNGTWQPFGGAISAKPIIWNKYVEPTIGPQGKILYPAGIWDSSETYDSTNTTTPYVYYNQKYYYVTGDPVVGVTPDTENSGWEEMSTYSAIYSDIGVFGNALVGSAVFNGDYMFSQEGKEKTSTNAWISSNNYKYFMKNSTSDDAGTTDGPYADDCVWRPSFCVNLRTGYLWTNHGAFATNNGGTHKDIMTNPDEVIVIGGENGMIRIGYGTDGETDINGKCVIIGENQNTGATKFQLDSDHFEIGNSYRGTNITASGQIHIDGGIGTISNDEYGESLGELTSGAVTSYIKVNGTGADSANVEIVLGDYTATQYGKTIINPRLISTTGQMEATNGFYETSDERKKDFIKDVDVDLEKLLSIPKKYFTWKNDSKLNIGTSAQELMKLYPELVSYDSVKDEYSVDYAKLSVIALSAVDVLYKQNLSFEQRLAKLEAKLS